MIQLSRYELLKLKQLDLSHEQPQDFVTAIWQLNLEKISGLYVTYRSLLAALFLCILVVHGSTHENPKYFFIYMTNIGFIIQTLHLIISAVLPIQHLLKASRGMLIDKMTLTAKVSWIFYNVTNVVMVVITVTYWAFIYSPGAQLTAMNFLLHGLICIVAACDVFIAMRPCRLLHFYQPAVVMVCYFIFSVIYWAAGGHNSDGFPYIYVVTNWEKPGLAVPLAISTIVVFVPLIHAFVWILHQLRDRLLLRVKYFNSVSPS